MVLNGLTITWKSPAIFGNFNKNKKSLKAFIYKQSLRKLKAFSDFLKSGADDGTRTHDLSLTNLKIFLQKLVLYADKSLINTSKNASIFL